jgi:hypothetical protein
VSKLVESDAGASGMDGGWLSAWLSGLSLVPLFAVILGFMIFAALAGLGARSLVQRRGGKQSDRSQESYLIGSMLGLLALLLAFSFSMAVSRFEERRHLVVEEANAIGTAYLRSQLLDQPHRERLSGLLVAYMNNRISLASADTAKLEQRLVRNDELLTYIWAAVTAARDSARTHGISTPLLAAFNQVVDLDSERKIARLVRVPQPILMLLLGFLVTNALVLGFVLNGLRAWLGASVLSVLLAAYASTIADLNRPGSGSITESQEPMLMLQQSLKSQPTEAFDRFATQGAPSP